jgi:serine protease Do
MRTIGRALFISGLAVGALILGGVIDIDVRWPDNGAQAIDLFGAEEPEAETAPPVAAGPFWTEGTNQPPIVPAGIPGSFADLAERGSRGVVNISTRKTVVGHSMEDFFPFPFREPFGGGGGGGPMEGKRLVPSLGSGFVISADGYIVTNNHVVEDVDSITIKFDDGRELPAEIVGRDPKTDLALLHVESDTPLFALPLGNSEAVRPGEWVVAIGNPFGLEHTVTAGIVSAKHRDIDQGIYDDYIQTDAAINPGNSGGPLINLRGEVIGINTAINPRANTIGFAVPINMAKQILPQLQANGHVTRGWLGVVIQQITPEIAEEFGLEDQTGALVSKVVPDGPAAEAGLQQRDVIREFDGTVIEEFDDLPRAVAATPVDKQVTVVVIRNGKSMKLRPVIAALEEPDLTQLASVEPTQGARAFGMAVQDLTPEIAQQLGMENVEGVVVSGVDPGGPAQEAGIRRGDVIVEVDQQEVKDADALQEQLSGADERALLLIRRGENQLYVPVKRETS